MVVASDETYRLNKTLIEQLKSNDWFKRLIMDVLNAGFIKAQAYQQDQQLTLYQRYTRKDVCRLLGWDIDVSSTLYGYRIRQNACPIFVTYAKSEEVEDSINYQDCFINTNLFQWYTRHNVRLESEEVQQMLDEKTNIHLFIKKNDDEGSDFTILEKLILKKNIKKNSVLKIKKSR